MLPFPSLQVDPYRGLAPHFRVASARARALHAVASGQARVVVASARGADAATGAAGRVRARLAADSTGSGRSAGAARRASGRWRLRAAGPGGRARRVLRARRHPRRLSRRRERCRSGSSSSATPSSRSADSIPATQRSVEALDQVVDRPGARVARDPTRRTIRCVRPGDDRRLPSARDAGSIVAEPTTSQAQVETGAGRRVQWRPVERAIGVRPGRPTRARRRALLRRLEDGCAPRLAPRHARRASSSLEATRHRRRQLHVSRISRRSEFTGRIPDWVADVRQALARPRRVVVRRRIARPRRAHRRTAERLRRARASAGRAADDVAAGAVIVADGQLSRGLPSAAAGLHDLRRDRRLRRRAPRDEPRQEAVRRGGVPVRSARSQGRRSDRPRRSRHRPVRRPQADLGRRRRHRPGIPRAPLSRRATSCSSRSSAST